MNGFDLGTVIAALEIMGKGMLGIFVTILIIMLCVTFTALVERTIAWSMHLAQELLYLW